MFASRPVMHCTLLLGVWCAVLVQIKGADALQCQTTKPEVVTVSVQSHRNQTGHWISQVETVSKGNTLKVAPAARMGKVDIQHSTANCGEDSAATLLITFTEPPPRVGSEYEFFPGVGYYKFHTNGTTWAKAREICANEGAHLTLIDSKDENDVILKLFVKNPKINGASHNNMDWAWIGVYEGPIVKEFFTVLDEPLNKNGFMKWHPGQPDDKTVNQFVGVSAYRTTGQMNDLDESWKLGFICEQEI